MSGSCGSHRLLIHSARQVVQVTATGEKMLTGARQMNSLAVLERRHDGQGLSVVVDRYASYGEQCERHSVQVQLPTLL